MDRKISFSGICRSEHGRTMLETLGVLALMGIISLLGVLSYGYAMRQYRENETVDQFSKTIASARTGFLKEQYMDKLQESVDSSGNLVYRLVNSSGGIETAPIIIPIRDIISGVDFNDENGPCPYASDDYCRTHWPDSFHTLIGADISVQIDNPEEFSVMIRGKSTKAGDYVEGHSVCRKLLGANFGQNSVYLKSMEGGMDSPRYTPSSLMGDEDKIDELCDQAVALATEETAGHFKMSLVFVFGNRVVTRCESDSDCVPANDYETCQCLSGMCICNEAEDLCYEHHGGLLTQEIYGGNLSGAWPSLEGSGLPTLTGSGKIGADCCEGAMIDMNQDVGYHASSPGFVYVDYKTGLIDCCPAGKSYELIGGSDVRHPMYYYTDDHNDKIYLRYALCDADRTCSGEAPYYCLDGCCSEECKYDGYCTKIDNGCDCKAGEVCMSAIMDSRTHGYFTQEDSFAGGALCCAKDRVYYDLMTGSLSCCDGTVDVQGGSSYLLNGHQEVASGCCGDCGTFTFVQETTVVPIECKDPAYPYACLDNADDSYGMCCSDSGCGGSCIDPEITTNVHCPDESKPYWCSGSESCCSKPCVGDQCITDCGSQSWCAKGGVKQTGACCDECCEDGTCASDYEGGECPPAPKCSEEEQACYDNDNNLADCCLANEVCREGVCETASCPKENTNCYVPYCDGVAKCDIINLADYSYFGSSATYGDGVSSCCPSDATVYYRTDTQEVDCCPAGEVFTQTGISTYADNSDGSCTPRIPIGICGEKPCCPVDSVPYYNDGAQCCADYLYLNPNVTASDCNGNANAINGGVCSECGDQDTYLKAVVYKNMFIDKSKINTDTVDSDLCCKDSANVYGYFDGSLRKIMFEDEGYTCENYNLPVSDPSNYYGVCGVKKLFYLDDLTEQIGCCDLSDGYQFVYRLTDDQGNPYVFDTDFTLTIDGVTKYPLRGYCYKSKEITTLETTTEEVTTYTEELTYTETITATDDGGNGNGTISEEIVTVTDTPIIQDEEIPCCFCVGAYILKDSCLNIIDGCCCQNEGCKKPEE